MLQLERRFVQDGATVNKVASGIERAQRQATERATVATRTYWPTWAAQAPTPSAT